MPAVSPTPIVAYSGALPDPSDRATYGARGRALWDWEVNTLLSGVNLHSVAAFENAQFAETMALASAAVANFRGLWSSLTGALARPASVSHASAIYALMADVADVTAHTPGVSSAWQLVGYSSSQITHAAGTVASKFASVDADLVVLATHESRLDGFDAVVSSGLGAHRNKLINGDWSQNQRVASSVADDAYFFDRWYILTETGNITVAQLTDPEAGAPFGVRLTQPDASPKRMGFAQIIEGRNIRSFAGKAMNLTARLRLSTGGNIRYAVIEHTGVADVVTSDVVNNWVSATFTPANFFIAGINVISTGTIAPGAATWGAVSDWDVLGASVKNVIVFIWTEAQVAQNVTLDCSLIQYEPGAIATPHEWRFNELALCQRYYFKTFPANIAPAQNAGFGGAFMSTSYGAGGGGATLRFPVDMRTLGAIATYNPAAANANWRDATNSVDRAIAAASAHSSGGIDLKFSASAATAAYNYIHLTVDSDL